MKEAMLVEVVGFPGHDGEVIEGYYARPVTAEAVGSVVVLHHAPGWDPWSKEVTRKLAFYGYAALVPHLYHRHGPGGWEEVASEARSHGIGAAMPDGRVIGDLRGAVTYLRAQPSSNGRVGVIGFCSGGRQAYLAACLVEDLDAAVDCWGGNVIAQPDPNRLGLPPGVIQHTEHMRPPLLGLFGNEDANPDPKQVDEIEATLQRQGKIYEFYRYDGAGHGFFATDRPAYRPEQAVDGWNKILAFFAKYLEAGEDHV